jgi:uncharacterized protein (TIGR02246 family)
MTTTQRWFAVLALSSMLGVNGVARAQATTVPDKDAAEIRAELQGMQDAWNRHDMKAFVSCMSDDVEWVNVVGMWWKGKDQVYRAHEAFHQTIFKNRQLHDPETIAMRSVAPDAVIVTEVVPADAYTTPDGRPQPATRNVLTEVFVRRSGKWVLVEGHNTVIVEASVKNNPIKD